jgi:hypothetical protein
MKFQFSVAIGDDQRLYSHLYVIASSEKHAREIVLQHLADRKPLGLSEAQIRRKNPKRTPWKPGLWVHSVLGGHPVSDDRKIGVVLENEEDRGFLF